MDPETTTRKPRGGGAPASHEEEQPPLPGPAGGEEKNRAGGAGVGAEAEKVLAGGAEAEKIRASGAENKLVRTSTLLRIGLSALAVILFFILYPRPPLPLAAVERARIALLEAEREVDRASGGGRGKAPSGGAASSGGVAGDLARAQSLGMTLERRFAGERGRWFRFRRSRELGKLAVETERAARAVSQRARATRSEAFSDARARRTELERVRSELASRVGLVAGEERLRAPLARADLALTQARSAERHRELKILQASLDQAEMELGRTATLLDQQLARLHDPRSRRRWQSWVDETIAGTRRGSSAIIVDKLGQRLLLVRGGRAVAQYDVNLGLRGLTDKAHAGDRATPEGRYRIQEKRGQGATRWHKALVLDYPNADNQRQYRRAMRRGEIPPGRGIGGLIEIHGHGGRDINWTDGCIALRNEDIDRLFAAVGVGTRVTIVGSARLPGDSPSKEGAGSLSEKGAPRKSDDDQRRSGIR